MKMNYTDKEIKEKLEKLLSPQRYAHTLGVSETAKKMAHMYGVDVDKAYIAGLLHDCAKFGTVDEQLKKCKETGLEISSEEYMCLPVIHAPLGARIAQLEYGIEDEEILNAIRFHTVAREGMCDLEKIIYIADMIEPTRDYAEVGYLRETAKKGLDIAMIQCLGECIMFNIKKKKTVHSNSIKCWNELMSKEIRNG
ncbi:MAG: bis(5'-nucleosyl)-tetraphosphatase (symmetrical) YqeK [Clostridia bacterium]|nr:bis(5'-nucleosyl)-tetraphosphatase (symmetrical) YqeK [Clostridia bacterium]